MRHACCLSYSLAAIFGRRLRGMGVSPMASATGQTLAASVLLVPLALAVDRPWSLPAPGWPAAGAVLGLAVLSTAFAYVLYFRLLASAGATNLLLVNFLVPVSAILLGTSFLGETPAPRHFAGMALIGIGLAAMDGRAWTWLRQRLA
ncbi:MAG: DMT family transporter [Amaricoccus sp.]